MDSGLELLEIFETSLPSNVVEGAVSWQLVETAMSSGVLSFTYEAGDGRSVSFESFASDLDELLAEGETPEMLLACTEAEMFERLSTIPIGGWGSVQRI